MPHSCESLFQLTLGAYAVEVADEDHFEENYGIDGRTTIVFTVVWTNFFVDEGEVDVAVDFTQQVILRDKFFDGHELEFRLMRIARTVHEVTTIMNF